MPSASPTHVQELDAPLLPSPVTELCARLEEHGIKAWVHGDGLLDALIPHLSHLPSRAPAGWGNERKTTHALLCEGTGEAVLQALPSAVVTTAHQARLTQATEWGPVDLIPLGSASLTLSLASFGFSALALAYRPTKAEWAETNDALKKTRSGLLDLASPAPGTASSVVGNVFADAPRRYWIAPRLMAEYGLSISEAALNAAQAVFTEVADVLPLGASARRMVDRVLASAEPGPALAFLRRSGVTPGLFPGAAASNEDLIGDLPPIQSVRWATWLRGSATQRGLVRLRAPHALAKRVERVQEAHPLDRSVPSLREASIRRILNRLEAPELDALFAWRRLELDSEASVGNPAEIGQISDRLKGLEEKIAETRAGLARTGTVRSLMLDGAAVMQVLNIGPGRQIGLALAHLARFIEMHPEKNERAELEAELLLWASRNPEKIS